MALSAQSTRLTVHSPSPTTIEYTVTNQRALHTSIARLTRRLQLVIRAGLALAALALMVSLVREALKAKAEENVTNGVSVGYCGTVHDWARAQGVQVDRRGTWIAVAFSAALLWLLSRRNTTEESLLVIRGLGVQISTSPRSWLSSTTTRFIPTTAIQDIFIHEAFVGFEVKFYLSIIVEGEKDAVVVFPKLMPRRHMLEEAWRGARRVLYQQPAEKQ